MLIESGFLEGDIFDCQNVPFWVFLAPNVRASD